MLFHFYISFRLLFYNFVPISPSQRQWVEFGYNISHQGDEICKQYAHVLWDYNNNHDDEWW